MKLMTTMPSDEGVVIFGVMKMSEFPKMLYIGTTQSHKHEIAQNAEHEAELCELGFVDFADLESEQAQLSSDTTGGASSEDFKNAFVPAEQFDAVSEQLVQKELQLNVAQTERDHFKAENDDLKAQVHQLNQLIDSFQPEQKTAEPVTVETDYNSLTTPALQKLLDEKGIAYLKRDDKATLIGLLTQPAKTEE